MDPLNFKPKNILPDELVDQLAKYWCDSSHTRDENLGQFIQRVAEIGQFSKPPNTKLKLDDLESQPTPPHFVRTVDKHFWEFG